MNGGTLSSGISVTYFANPSGTRISTYCAMSTAPTFCDFTPAVTGTSLQ